MHTTHCVRNAAASSSLCSLDTASASGWDKVVALVSLRGPRGGRVGVHGRAEKTSAGDNGATVAGEGDAAWPEPVHTVASGVCGVDVGCIFAVDVRAEGGARGARCHGTWPWP